MKITIKKTKNTSENIKFSTASIIMMAVSICAYYAPGFIDRQFGLSSGTYRIAMLFVAGIAVISAISAFIAAFYALGWRKILFILFFLISVGVCGIALLVAGLARHRIFEGNTTRPTPHARLIADVGGTNGGM